MDIINVKSFLWMWYILRFIISAVHFPIPVHKIHISCFFARNLQNIFYNKFSQIFCNFWRVYLKSFGFSLRCLTYFQKASAIIQVKWVHWAFLGFKKGNLIINISHWESFLCPIVLFVSACSFWCYFWPSIRGGISNQNYLVYFVLFV